ncbi:MAG: amidohydrolase family protein [bacterium]|nr:amidohydrolase family protein [bacterium]
MSTEIIDGNTFFGFYPKRNLDTSVTQLLNMMKKNNISRAITISLQSIHYDYRLGNQETIEVAQANPNLTPAFSVDPREYFGCFDEINLRASQGCKLIRLFPEVQGWHFDAAPLPKILRAIADAKLILMVESRAWGVATKYAELAQRYGFPIILTGISYFNFGEALELLKTVPKVYLEPRILDTPDGIDLAVKEAGADRLIFGSHAPFDYIEPALMLIERSHISQEEKSLILAENIKKLLQI